ncbi:hypothetical protein E8E12_002590 [Didymella heteroderae]|uniref:CID domain-containing protein n=1 Tax=Didymella heteroderae TaxID=1769908 RepID=A0A9P4WJM2_9PLEO|nr:hypothetical protein E8E12_002590 [Didymella heteroderae]
MAQNDDAKRANTVITIAQLKFKQNLKKEEPEARLPPVPVDACSQLFRALDAVLAQNTSVNIQKCTEWIVQHIAPSRIRIALLGDYLVSVSKSLVVDTTSASGKKATRNRLDLLFVVNDALHTDKYHHNSATKHGLLGTEMTSQLAELVELAASCAVEEGSQSEKKLRALINFWAVNQLIGQDVCKTLKEQVDESILQAQGGAPIRKRNYLLPEYHGDRTAPWYELPASYMLDQMIKQPNRPLDPHRIKVTRFGKKPVSTHVRKLLDNYFENVDLKHTPTGDNPTGETQKYNLWLDPMGQLVKRNKETGETTTATNGYGWSMKFCEDMQRDGVPESIKTLREDAERMEAAPERQRDERRYSRSPRRRRRSSSASSRGRGRDRRSRSDSYASRSSYDSRSRSHSRHHDHRRRSPRDEDRGRNNRDGRFDDRENDIKRAPPRPIERAQSQSGQWNGQQGPNRNSQGSPGKGHLPPNVPQNFTPNFPQASQPPFNAPPFPPPMPNQFPGAFPLQPFPPPPPPMQFQGPGGFPGGVPPPPPPNFSGPYPPPPPNIAGMPNNPYNFNNQWGNFQQGANPGFNQQQNPGGFQNQGYNQSQAQGQGGFQGGRGGHGGNSQGAIASSTTIDLEAPIPDWTSPQISIDVRGDSFHRGEYEPFSEIPESQSSPERSAAEGTTLQSSQLFASQPAFLVSGIVRDTQSSAGDVSYIPVTQEQLEPSLHSDWSDESNEDHIIGYSGLLDTDEAPKLGARAHSPATSIAETVVDATQESNSQRQLESQQERSGISDTFESQSPAISSKADRTGAQDNSGSSHQTEADWTQPQGSPEPTQAKSPVLFVANTTQFDHDISVREPEQLLQEQNESGSTTQDVPEATTITQLPASVEGSELLAVADTPQISQLSSTTRKETTQEVQPNPARRLESAQPNAELDNEIPPTNRSVWEENAQFPFFSQHPAFFDPPSVTKLTQLKAPVPIHPWKAALFVKVRKALP